MVKCVTRNLEAPGSSRTGFSGFFRESVLGQDTSEPQPRTGETQGIHEFVSYRRDMGEITLKAA